jgi:exopolysaccharide biosynthesis operon protein EpsL
MSYEKYPISLHILTFEQEKVPSDSKACRTPETTMKCANAQKVSRSKPGKLAQLLTATGFGIILVTASWTAHAQFGNAGDSSTDNPFKVFTVLVDGSVTSDSNLFRRPEAFAQSDTISTGKLGFRFDKPYGQQNFQLEVAKTITKYEKFSYLDFDSTNYNGAWRWHFGPRISGKLSASRSESLAPFEDALGTQRNVRISQNQAFDLDALVSGGWHLLLGTAQNDQKSEQSTVINRTPDFRSTSANAGIKYQTKAGNAITARWQTTDGEYINNPVGALNTDYTENLSEIEAAWKISGNSTINARLGWLERENSDVTRRSFSGPSSSLNYSWTPAGKLGLTLTAARKASPLQVIGASYKEDSSLAISPTWRTSDKTSAYLTYSYQKSEDQASGAPLVTPLREDITQTITLGVSWSAMRKLTFNTSVKQLQRTSNVVFTDYDATVASISAALTF